MREGIEMLSETLPWNLLEELEIQVFNRQMHELENKILLPAEPGFFTPSGRLCRMDMICPATGEDWWTFQVQKAEY